MKLHPIVSLCLATTVLLASGMDVLAQERIYRCDNEYTNNAELARSRGCKAISGGNLTIIPGTTPARSTDTRPAAVRPIAGTNAPRSGAQRVDPGDQRARDSDARAILEAELRKAQERLAQAEKAYANGAPEKEGIESRNYQRYLDRVAGLKAALGRAQGDVESIRRELARLGVAPGASATGSP